MNFAALPPEINSGLMYAGPGGGPMLAAAAAWDGIAAELRSTATACESVLSRLVGGSWSGPAAATMAAAAAPYVGWLTATAAQAELTATQARAATAAYEAAFAMTVSPPVIAANRAQLATLVVSNIFGQNTAAIAVNEALYGQMWAQDAAAMYGYAGAAAGVTGPAPFTSPPQIANPAGRTGAAQAVAAAQSALSQAASAAAGPAQGITLPPTLATMISIESAFAPGLTAASLSVGASSWNAAANNGRLLLRNTDEILSNHEVLLGSDEEILRAEGQILGILGGSQYPGGLTSALAGADRIPVSAGLARAVSVGKLAVPLNWAVAAPELRTVAYAAPLAGAGPAVPAGAPAAAFGQMALAGMGGSALAGSMNARDAAATAPAVTAQPAPTPPAEEPEEPAQSPVAELVVGIRQLGELRDSGLLSAEEFRDQKQRLLERPLQQ